jgi:hypothetical protein
MLKRIESSSGMKVLSRNGMKIHRIPVIAVIGNDHIKLFKTTGLLFNEVTLTSRHVLKYHSKLA